MRGVKQFRWKYLLTWDRGAAHVRVPPQDGGITQRWSHGVGPQKLISVCHLLVRRADCSVITMITDTHCAATGPWTVQPEDMKKTLILMKAYRDTYLKKHTFNIMSIHNSSNQPEQRCTEADPDLWPPCGGTKNSPSGTNRVYGNNV